MYRVCKATYSGTKWKDTVRHTKLYKLYLASRSAFNDKITIYVARPIHIPAIHKTPTHKTLFYFTLTRPKTSRFIRIGTVSVRWQYVPGAWSASGKTRLCNYKASIIESNEPFLAQASHWTYNQETHNVSKDRLLRNSERILVRTLSLRSFWRILPTVQIIVADFIEEN